MEIVRRELLQSEQTLYSILYAQQIMQLKQAIEVKRFELISGKSLSIFYKWFHQKKLFLFNDLHVKVKSLF